MLLLCIAAAVKIVVAVTVERMRINDDEDAVEPVFFVDLNCLQYRTMDIVHNTVLAPLYGMKKIVLFTILHLLAVSINGDRCDICARNTV